MTLSTWVFAFACALGATAACAQDAQRTDPCHAMPADESAAAKNFLNFDEFDKELRVALEKQDPVALAFLVTFPLRVNDAGGSITLNNVAALKTHFQEVFTPAVRKEILSDRKEEVGCDDEGIMYERGVIWVNASERGYAIWSVNRDEVPPYPENPWNTPKINYVCQTQTYRIAIDTLAGRALRYRAWNKPRPVTEAPDLEIARGDGTFEGSGVCAYPVFTFRNAAAVYRVEGALACPGDLDVPPKDATGRLEVTVVGQPTKGSWCY